MENRILNNFMQMILIIVLYWPGAYGIAPGASKLELRQNWLLYSIDTL